MNEAMDASTTLLDPSAIVARNLTVPKRPAAMPDIVLYEDDEGLAREIVLAFEAEKYGVTLAKSEAALLAIATKRPATVLIMDRMVSGEDSLLTIQRMRDLGSLVPVIVISNMTSVDDRILGLKAGGDDYLIKPFSMGELVARVEVLMRRLAGEGRETRETRLVAGDLEMDLIDRTVRRGSRAITLLPREFVLLEFFMRRQDQVITRAMMLEGVWKYRAPMNTNVVDVHISNLRRKIDGEGEPQLLKNKRGIGFILTATGMES